MRFGAATNLLSGFRCKYLSHGVMAIDQSKTSSVNDELRLRFRIADASFQPCGIPGETHHAVRLMSPKVRLNEGVGT